jgi:hypothetical protein
MARSNLKAPFYAAPIDWLAPNSSRYSLSHRHWHPNGKIVYSINELANVLNVYAWDGNGPPYAT